MYTTWLACILYFVNFIFYIAQAAKGGPWVEIYEHVGMATIKTANDEDFKNPTYTSGGEVWLPALQIVIGAAVFYPGYLYY